MNFFKPLFSPDFMPHGYCYQWNPWIVWLHVVSDTLITVSYYCIPLVLIYFVRKRRDLPFNWIFVMFGIFILGCGTTHLMEVWTVWHPDYLLSGIIKALTAAVSVATAILLIPLVPQALNLPSPSHLQEINNQLEKEIAERKRAQDEIHTLNWELERRNLDLVTANEELESFSYSVSHDLRAPLRHMNGFSRLLHDEYSSTLDPGALHYLHMIRGSAKTMSELVDGLLNMGRIGRVEVIYKLTDLNALTQSVILDLELDCLDRQINWRIGELPTVVCDPSLMKQVFANLLGNAIKYTRRRNDAVIEVGELSLEGESVIFIRDNGAGFDQKYAHKLFGAFQRLHRADEFEGTGVGLATVQRILRKHGGRIWAEGEVNKGASFYFVLGKNNHMIAKERSAAMGMSE